MRLLFGRVTLSAVLVLTVSATAFGQNLEQFFGFAVKALQAEQEQRQAAAPFRLSHDARWLLVASRPTENEAVDFARDQLAVFPDTIVVRTVNGLYAIVVGVIPIERSEERLKWLKALRTIPQDSLLADGGRFVALIWPGEPPQIERPVYEEDAFRRAVVRIQQALTELGMYGGDLDGVAGAQTISAIAAYRDAFNLPDDVVMTGTEIQTLETVAQAGFTNAHEYQAARGGGFGTKTEYQIATSGGFSSLAEYERAKAAGFQTRSEWNDARERGFSTASAYRRAQEGGFRTTGELEAAEHGGFSTAEEYQLATAAGFKLKTDYDRATQAGFSSRTEMEAAQRQGFQTKSEQDEARVGGFADKTEYDLALAAGFSTKEDFERFQNSGFGTKQEYLSALRDGHQTKADYDQAQEEARAELKDQASILIADVEEFLRQYPGLPEILQIAEAVSAVQATALSGSIEQIREAQTRLTQLMRAVSKFDQFSQERAAERQRAHQQAVNRAADGMTDRAHFARDWIGRNVTDKATPDLVRLLKELDAALAARELESMERLTAEVDRTFAKYGLSGEYAIESQAQAANSTEAVELDAARKQGFPNTSEMGKAHEGGFTSKKEFDAAAQAGFSTKIEYDEFRASGFASREEFDRAVREGHRTKADYEQAQETARADFAAAASELVSDASEFLRLNPELPELIQIAEIVSVLQGALPNGTAVELNEPKLRLQKLLQSVPGFPQFTEARALERQTVREEALTKAVQLLDEKASFVRRWIAGNVTAKPAAELAALLKQVDAALATPEPKRLEELSSALDVAFAKHGMEDDYLAHTSSARRMPNSADSEAGLDGAVPVTDRNRFLLEGDVDDIVLMSNASGEAPHFYKNIRGEVGFEDGLAIICHGGSSALDAFRLRVIKGELRKAGAQEITIHEQTCDGLDFGEYDVAITQRGAFLRSSPSLVMMLNELVNSGKLVELRTINAGTIRKIAEGEQATSLQLEADLENGARSGFGIVLIPGTGSILCATPQEKQAGHGAILAKIRTDLKEDFGTDPQVVSTSVEAAFIAIQRGRCRAIYANAKELSRVVEALRRDGRDYAIMPIWVDQEEVDSAEVAVQKERERIAEEELQRRRRYEEAEMLAAQRERDAAQLRESRERVMQERSGAQARALQLEVQRVVEDLLSGKQTPATTLFPQLAKWYSEQRLDHWDFVALTTEVEDYGLSDWKDRKLETIAVKAIVRDRNRDLGENRTTCFTLGWIIDDEFSVYRDPVETQCQSGSEQIANWKNGHGFESMWTAN
jgi:peptidoglycan hydrolase-like protein with peptidoglycan-binding domain